MKISFKIDIKKIIDQIAIVFYPIIEKFSDSGFQEKIINLFKEEIKKNKEEVDLEESDKDLKV